MPGHALVQRERAHAELAHLVHVAQVGVEDAGPCAVEGGLDVVRARRGLLLELGNSSDLDGRLRNQPDHRARQHELFVDHLGVVGERGPATVVGVRVEKACVLGEARKRPGRGLAGLQLRLRGEDRRHLGLDARHLREAEVVHLLRRHPRRRLGAQAVGVVGVAVGQLPDAVVAGGALQLAFEEADQLAVGRQHAALDRLRTTRGQRLLVGRRELGQGIDLGGEVLVQRVLERRLAGEGPHLGEHALDHEARRHDPVLLAQRKPVEHLVELATDLAEPREIVLGAAPVGDAVLVDEEVGRVVLHPPELVHRVVVKAELLAVELVLDVHREHARGQPLRRRLRGEVVGFEVREVAVPEREVALRLGDRLIVEMGVVAAVAELLGDAERAQQFGVFEREGDEGLLVEEVQAEGPEPDQVDDEHRYGEQGNAEQRGQPFEEGLEHRASIDQRLHGAAVQRRPLRLTIASGRLPFNCRSMPSFRLPRSAITRSTWP